jgi:NAD(P)H-dependent FMN reductase
MSARIFAFLNGSLRGTAGNSNTLLAAARRALPPSVECDEIVLAEYAGTVEALAGRLERADALLFATGVYWSSWGSPLQRFLEVFSGYELTSCFLGKPAGALVSMDSVGGADVAQRLLGVLGWFGCLVPPLASVVISRTGSGVRDQPGFEDVFQVDDIRVLVANLCAAVPSRQTAWNTWPITHLDRASGSYPQSGPLLGGLGRFG